MEQIKTLYEQEIAAYKDQIGNLRSRNKESDLKNNALLNQLKNIENELEQTRQANNDLKVAYQHIHDANLKLQVVSKPEVQVPAIPERRVEQNSEEILSWVSDRDRLNQRVKFLERECVRYQRDNTTLGKQVRHLLRALEEERGMIIPHQSQPKEDSPIITAVDVIDKHLVTFNSIEQLQKQNQQLISVVKDLSSEQELKDATIESEEVKRLTDQVKELSTNLESIKSDRERVLAALNTIHRERDLFKILLCKTREATEMTPEIFQRMVAVACSSGPAIEDSVSKLAEKESHIKDLREMNTRLQNEIDLYKKEINELRQEFNEEIKLKDSLLQQAHSKILDETKRADVLDDRNQVLEKNIESLTGEYDDLRAKCSKMTFEMGSVIEESDKKLAEKESHIKDLREMNIRLQGEVDEYKKEINELRQAFSEEIKLKDSLIQEANAKILEETKRADALNDTIQMLNDKNEILNQKCEMLVDKNQISEKNVDNLSAECQELRANYSKLMIERDQKQVNESQQEQASERERKLLEAEKERKLLEAEKERRLLEAEREQKLLAAEKEQTLLAAERGQKLLAAENELKKKDESIELVRRQFYIMQALRNQERLMRLDMNQLIRTKRPTKKKVQLAPVPEPVEVIEEKVEPEQTPQVEPAPKKAITLKRRNLS